MRLVISMPWETSLSVNASHFGAGGKFRRKPNVQAWMRSLAWRIKAETIGLPWSLPIRVVVDFRYPDKRARDAENWLKAIQDAVADGLGLAKRPGMGDENIRITTGMIEVDKANPGFTITIEDDETKPDSA